MIFFQILYILNVFIAPLFLKATFAGYRILGWQDSIPFFLLPEPPFYYFIVVLAICLSIVFYLYCLQWEIWSSFLDMQCVLLYGWIWVSFITDSEQFVPWYRSFPLIFLVLGTSWALGSVNSQFPSSLEIFKPLFLQILPLSLPFKDSNYVHISPLKLCHSSLLFCSFFKLWIG